MRHSISSTRIFWYYNGRKLIRAGTAVALLAMVAAAWVSWPAVSFAARAITAPSSSLAHEGGVVSILVIGHDWEYAADKRRDWRRGNGDTLLQASIDVSKLSVNLTSIPRDVRVRLPNGRVDKINAAAAIGGGKMQSEAVERLTGVPVHHRIEVGPDFVGRLVDGLGGVQVHVEANMDYDDNAAGLHIHLKKGWHTLSGREAEGFVRFRDPVDADLGRVRRQRIFAAALMERLKRVGPFQAPVLYRAIRPAMVTDLTEEQLMLLVRWVVMGARVRRTATLPVQPVSLAYVRVDWRRALPVVQSMLHYTPAEVRRLRECPVQYANLGKTPGAAQAYATRHARLGLGRATCTSDYDGPPVAKHSVTIFYRQGLEKEAALVARLFHEPTLKRGDTAGHALLVAANP